MHFRTKAIHVGNQRDPQTGAVVAPLHLATTFVQEGSGQWGAFDYSRSGNPTRARLEQTLAAVEHGTHALAYASGMAATHGVMMLLKPGDHVVAGADLYGGTYRLLASHFAPLGIAVDFVRTDDVANLRAALRPETRLVWLETPGNPLLSVTDLAACAAAAHEAGALVGVDNTLASPALTRPLDHGADVVMHSATKFIGGHSDVLGGVLVVKNEALHRRLYQLLNMTGGVMAPLESYLCQRGIKTLELRVREQSRSALTLAERLAGDRRVRRVNYPGLPDHPGHDVAKRQMEGGFGAVLSFELEAGSPAARHLVGSTKLFQLAVSLGAVESLISQPALMSHASYDPAARRAMGISDALVRLAVGLEHPDDLWADLDAAMG